MSAIALTTTGDFDLSSGNLQIVADPAQALAIELRARFKLWLGEWYLDTRIGVPYRQVVLVKNPNIAIIRTLFKKVILDTPGVKTLDQFSLTYDPRTRTAAFSFSATTDTGAVISGGSGQPFIVDQAK